MGFTPEPTILKLVFADDTPLHGLVVRAKPCTVGEWNELLERSGTPTSGRDTVEANNWVAELFLQHVVSWDLEIPAGSPVPLTLEGWNKVDNSHANMIIGAWQVAMISVPKTSKSESPDGEISEEQQLGLANLSESLPNWVPPS